MNNQIKARENKIKVRLENDEDLTDSQVQYVQDNIEPKYENECNHCRANVLMYFGYTYEQASDFAYARLADYSTYVSYEEHFDMITGESK